MKRLTRMRSLLVAGCLLACIGVACGGGSASGNGDGSTTNLPPPDAFVQATLGAGTNGAQCPLSGAATAVLSIGSPTPGKPTTVQDGGANGGGTAVVACKVAASGSSLALQLSAQQQGAMGAGLSITGTVDPSAGGMSVTASLSDTTGGQYGSSTCAITYDYQGSPVPASPMVAAGRAWGHVSCSSAHAASGMGQCDLEADFLFEQCSE